MYGKKLTRIISMSCIAAMLLSMTGCSGSGGDTKQGAESTTSAEAGTENTKEADANFDPMAKYEEPITITTAVGLDDRMQQLIGVKADVQTNNNWYKGYEEELGIHVENIWSVPGTQYKEKLNAQISANDLPDVFTVNAEQLKTLVDAGMVADLTETYEKYASDFTKEMMVADENVALSQSMYNGKLMALPQVSGNYDGVPIMWVRTDWMKKVGMKAPKTVEELEALALAFVNDDPDGNGKNDTFGIALSKDVYDNGLCELTGPMAMFGAYKGWVDVNGKAEYGRIQPEAKTTLEKMASWYEKGIFDKEFVAKDSSKVAEDLISGKVGISFGSHGNAFWPFPDSKNLNKDAEWEAFPIPSATGKPVQVMVGGSAGNFYVANVDCKNPEAIVKMYNYFFKKDCALSPDFDQTFHIAGNEMEHPEQSASWGIMRPCYPQQNLFIYRGVKAYLEGDESAMENAWVSGNVEQVTNYMEDPEKYKTDYGTYLWSGPKGAFSAIETYGENEQRLQDLYILGNTDGMAMYNVTLNQLALETYTKIITGEQPVSSFDEFVSQWKSLGGDQITQEVNDAIGK